MPPVVIDIRSADDRRDIVHRAVQALVEGQLVAFPTETVYRLAASALDPEAVARLRSVRGGPESERLNLVVRSADDALDYVPDISRMGRRLARRCWPGPVTLVVDDRHPDSLITQLPHSVQQALTGGGPIAIEVPAHSTIRDALRLLPGPLAITSATRSGRADALSADDVIEALDDDVQLVLDDGRSRYGQPSSVVRVRENDFDVLCTGVVSEQTLRRLASQMILFVCTGNTCRSPMAEALCRKLIAQRLGCRTDEVEDRGTMIASAGIAAMMGGRPSPEAVAVMAKEGLDLSTHESQPLTEQLVRNADVIFTMTRAHRDAILAAWPDAAARTRLLCRDRADVSDPIGGPAELYETCADQIKQQLSAWVDQLDL